MSNGLIIAGGKRDLRLRSRLLNSAGTLGFSDEANGLIPLESLGGFITNPISNHRRTPANNSGAQRYLGGLLLHSGHPNPGISAALRRHRSSWARRRVPTIVHLIGHSIGEYERMILELEQETAVAAVELGLEMADSNAIEQFGQLAQRAELPVLLRLPLDAPANLFIRAADAGAPALSFGPPRGSLLAGEGYSESGRMYGPSLFPLAMARLSEIRSSLQVPIIASGGVQDADSARQMLQAGAAALQLDLALWLTPSWLQDEEWRHP